MASQHDEMFFDTMNRSPTNPRGYNTLGGMNRQTSRPYDAYGPPSAMYGTDDYAPTRYDTQRADRSAPPMFNNYSGYDQTWNYNAPATNANTLGATTRSRSTARRAPLPNAWVDSAANYPPMPTGQGMNGMADGHVPPLPYGAAQLSRNDRTPSDQDEELIPTAIVIKNIPFAIKREQLTELMSDMHLPLPYAFNYHFDNGVFRGLAFANFSTPEETAEVIQGMNHLDLQGRKLRVEYKKMLPLQERERIEREKRERRGQLEEQHRPIQPINLQNQHSTSSLNSAHPTTSPSPVSMRAGMPGPSPDSGKLDMNDPTTLEFYARLVVFKDDDSRRIMVFDAPLSAVHRRILHELAHKLGLEHESVGQDEHRHVQIFKDKIRNPIQSMPYSDPSKRGLNRAATMELNGTREPVYPGLRSHNSALLEIPGSPGLNGGINGRLREAKSFGDLQHRTSSPSALSTSSFPVALRENVSRYTEHGMLNDGANAPSLTPNAGLGLASRDDPSFLSSGFANLSVGYDRPVQSRINGRLINNDAPNTAGAIGSQRGLNGLSSLNTNHDEQSRSTTTSAAPERQPRGPGSEWGSGFGRPRQRGSGDLDGSEPDRF